MPSVCSTKVQPNSGMTWLGLFLRAGLALDDLPGLARQGHGIRGPRGRGVEVEGGGRPSTPRPDQTDQVTNLVV